jgi:hypothetical protein
MRRCAGLSHFLIGGSCDVLLRPGTVPCAAVGCLMCLMGWDLRAWFYSARELAVPAPGWVSSVGLVGTGGFILRISVLTFPSRGLVFRRRDRVVAASTRENSSQLSLLMRPHPARFTDSRRIIASVTRRPSQSAASCKCSAGTTFLVLLRL